MEYTIYRTFSGGFHSFYSNIDLDRSKYSEQYLQILSEHSYDAQVRERMKEEFLRLTGEPLPYMEDQGEVRFYRTGNGDALILTFWLHRDYGLCFSMIQPEREERCFYLMHADRGESFESLDFPKRMVHTGIFFPAEQAWEIISQFIESGDVPDNIVLKRQEDFPVVSESFQYDGGHGTPMLQGLCAKYYGSSMWKRLEKFGRKSGAYVHAPVTPKEHRRMEPFAGDDGLVEAVLDVLGDYNMPPYIGEQEWLGLSLCFHVPCFWYGISLISGAEHHREHALAYLRKLAVMLKGNAVENEDDTFMLLRNISVWKEKYPDLAEIEKMLATD